MNKKLVAKELLAIAKLLAAGKDTRKKFCDGYFGSRFYSVSANLYLKEDGEIEEIHFDITNPPSMNADFIKGSKDKNEFLGRIDRWLVAIEDYKKGVIELKKYLKGVDLNE